MKKHVIALAVASAVAVPAMAQNVSISGRIDTSLASISDNASSKSQRFLLSDLMTSNQIVIGGSEDLGGGLKANFNIISPFASDSNNTVSTQATGVASGAASGFNFGGRGMVVGLSGGFGSVEIGRSPGSMANSVMASGFSGNIGNLGALNARPDNSISYSTPRISGVVGRVLHSLGNENADNPSSSRYTEVSGDYTSGPLLARVFYGKMNATTSVTATAASTSALQERKETGAQVNYDFGPAAVNVRYVKLDVDGGSTYDTSRLGLGVSIPFANGISVFADTWSMDADGSADYTNTSVGIVKALSKRTNIYAVASKTKNDTTGTAGAFGGAYSSTSYVNGGTVPHAVAADKDPSGFAVGIRHAF